LLSHVMSLLFPLRRAFSTSVRCSYRTKKIPEDVVANTSATQKRTRGRPKNIEGVKPKPVPQDVSPSTANRRRKIRRGPISLPDNRLDLPPHSQWINYFPTSGIALRGRISLANPETAALVADSFVPEGSKGKVIIEAYPG